MEQAYQTWVACVDDPNRQVTVVDEVGASQSFTRETTQRAFSAMLDAICGIRRKVQSIAVMTDGKMLIITELKEGEYQRT